MGSAIDRTTFERLVSDLAREISQLKESAEVLNIGIRKVADSIQLLGQLAETFERLRQPQTSNQLSDSEGSESDNSTIAGSLNPLSDSEEEAVSGISEGEESEQEELVVD